MINYYLANIAKSNFLNKGRALALWTILGFTCFYYLSFLSVFPANKLIAPGDGWREFVPTFYAKKALWLNLLCTGFPVIGDPQFQLWYPPALIFQCFHSYNGFVISAYVLASCFAYLFTYTLTKSKLAATISGICYGISGFFIGHLEHVSMTHAALWVPLILTAIEKLRQEKNIFWLITGSIAVFMTMLGGHPQISIYGLLLASTYALYVGIFQKQRRLEYFIASIGMFILGIGLTAIQIIPTIEWIHQSTRESMPYGRFVSHPVTPIEFWQLIYPNLCHTFYREISCYVGILPLLLILLAVFARYTNRDFLFWCSATVVSVCLMLGNATPIAKLMYHVPVYNLFRCICRNGLEFTIAISTLAGLIISYIETNIDKKPLLKYGLASCAAFLILIMLGTYYCQNGLAIEYAKWATTCNLNLNPLENKAVAIPIIVTLASAISLLLWLQNTKIVWRKITLITIFTLDMLASGFWFSTNYPPRSLPNSSIVQNPPPIAIALHELLAHSGQRLFPLPTYEHMDLDLAISGIAPNLSLLWNIPVANGYPIRFKRYADLFDITEYGHSHLIFDSIGCEFDLASVKYLISSEVKLSDNYPDPSNNKHFRKFAIFGPSTVYENLHAMPRAWLTGETISLPANDILQTIHSCHLPNGSHFNPAQTALIEDPLVPKIKSDITDGAVQTVKLKNTFEEFKTNCSQPAMLVVSDLFYPGWEAKIDGEPTTIYITNYAFRGIFIKPGNHQITFEYKPKSLYWGIAISSLSLLSLIIIMTSSGINKWIRLRRAQ